MTRPPAKIATLANGKRQIQLVNAPALSKFQHKDTWTARDAAHMHSLMSNYYSSPFALVTLSSMWETISSPHATESEYWNEVRHFAKTLHRAWADLNFTAILADEAFAQMMRAAAITAPHEPIHEDELIAPSGVIFFEEKQDLSEVIDPSDWKSHTPNTAAKLTKVRAIQWVSIDAPDISQKIFFAQVMVDGSDALDNPGSNQLLNPDECSYYLSAFIAINMTYEYHRAPSKDQANNNLIINLLRSATAIARSPQTSNTLVMPQTGMTKKQKRSRKGRSLSKDIRVLSLRNPEHGRFELDAATGHKLRAHWVRGHWRNQWYASTEEHRTIWIDGFVKGDADLGTVTGPKVYVARAPKTDDDEDDDQA